MRQKIISSPPEIELIRCIVGDIKCAKIPTGIWIKQFIGRIAKDAGSIGGSHSGPLWNCFVRLPQPDVVLWVNKNGSRETTNLECNIPIGVHHIAQLTVSHTIESLICIIRLNWNQVRNHLPFCKGSCDNCNHHEYICTNLFHINVCYIYIRWYSIVTVPLFPFWS